ncbi:piggyBac transposable element-derived protein 4-like [Macrobrachium nipponense]|uniref:piggyBac transposable element-derived protein 4-like n=1 Tax=Macrobrachium nipponense TaxID=159736 RepID=UPI0030C82A04
MAIYRERRKIYPALPKSRADVHDTLDVLKIETNKNEEFCLVNDKDEGIVIFSCHANLVALCTQVKELSSEEELSSDDEYIHSETGSSSSSEESLHDDSENQITEEEQENEEENEEEILNEDTSPPNAEWTKVTKKARQHGFTGKEELCVTVHPSSTDNQIWPIDVYKQIITDDIINLIVQETNRYAEQKISSVTVTRRSKLRQWVPTNNEEIEKFIGLIIYMGLVPFPEIQLYWSKSILYKNEIVPKTMSRDRFLLLLQMLHFCNNEEPNVGRDWKIRKLLDMILVQYQSIYKSGSDVIIDESMVPFRGRVIFRQYIPGKSHKYGCKLFNFALLRIHSKHGVIYL